MTPFLFGQKLASQPSFLGDYAHQLNKFYNPWSNAWNEPANDGIEQGLQYAGRGAMGLGAGALAAAGGIAAAPTIAGAGNAAAGAIGAGVTAAGSQMAKLPSIANNAANSTAQFIARNPFVTENVSRIAINDAARVAPSFHNPAQSLNTTKDTINKAFDLVQ